MFPPSAVLGTFDNVLPHVVLSRRTLPWERLPQHPREALPDGPPLSWLALLVFPAASAPPPTTGTLADLVPQSLEGGQLPAGSWSYGSVYASMEDFLEVAETAADPCVYLDVPIAQFAACAPSAGDLAWNAHLRSPTSTSDSFNSFYSVVVANSLPAPGQAAVVHLVSLEGLLDQLPQDDGTFAAPQSWTSIRLVTLRSWQFRVAPLEASFAHMLLGLNGGVAAQSGIATETGDSQLRLPKGVYPAAAPVGAPALPFDSGYTMLAGGGPAAPAPAWYRGPLLPSTFTPAPADAQWGGPLLPADEADALALAVAANPALDQSYAAAWQIGRMLALADQDFATGQVAWKRDARLQLNTALGQANRVACGSRAAFAKLMRAVLADPAQIQGVLGPSLSVGGGAGTLPIPQPLVDWLGKLAQLQLVPFHYLVPDAGMFPPESLRFFALDPRWLACLLDGAWSLGRQPRRDWAFDLAYQPWRQLLDGTLVPSGTPAWSWPAAGLLLNSQVIPGYWPGIEFVPRPAATILREDLLGPGTLIMLFSAPLQSLTIKQPSAGIHFGFEIDENDVLTKLLRYVDIAGTFYPTPPAGTSVAAGQEAPAACALAALPQRTPTLIQFDRLAQAIGTAIGAPALRPVDFAVELVESVSSVTFDLPEGAGA
ncbi:MAG TPA: hypothetical protein VF727_04710 [Allosphingosinicella sp.]